MTGQRIALAWGGLGLLAVLAACSGPAAAPLTVDDAPPAAIPASFALNSASLALPEERAVLAATPSGDLLTQNCTGCHSAEMLTSQPPLDTAKWQGEIDKMRKVFHAPIPVENDPALLAALADLQASRAQ